MAARYAVTFPDVDGPRTFHVWAESSIDALRVVAAKMEYEEKIGVPPGQMRADHVGDEPQLGDLDATPPWSLRRVPPERAPAEPARRRGGRGELALGFAALAGIVGLWAAFRLGLGELLEKL